MNAILETLAEKIPPPKIPAVGTGFSDYIRDLGDTIVGLSREDRNELHRYILQVIK